MLVRIVKMGFYKQNIDVFLDNFENTKREIRAFEGCNFLELYRDKTNPTIFFTYSYWESEEALDNYKKSELFKRVWGKIKPLFSIRPEAWSADKLETLD
ncbi:putative quinol monooxygenase [Tamlana crocina]|uniref:Antibiotic biosynthesis monooxygenase n=1 Tax=Tamlana crocina TaxID=393006 RepID=A0ABX1DDF3_9FLAO|nr:antibiotic biosynthesis monooxygenase family protein [Tamlana crocina]NJX16295.1 antibiotic biosynthesis monooxygenase [Tamlana crocina]